MLKWIERYQLGCCRENVPEDLKEKQIKIEKLDGKKIIVKESRQKVKNLVKLYRKEIFSIPLD